MKAHVFIFSFCISNLSFAQELNLTMAEADWNSQQLCQSAPGIEAKLGPVRSQVQRGWCYSEAGADLVTAATGVYISNADIAIQYNKDFQTSDKGLCSENKFAKDGGNTETAINVTAKIGFCAAKDFPNDRFMTLEPQVFNQKLRILEEASKKHQCNQKTIQALEFFFPKESKKALQDLAEILKRSSESDFLSNLAEHSCTNRIKPNIHPVTLDFLRNGLSGGSKRAEMFQVMQKLRDGSPIAVSLDIGKLLNDQHRLYFTEAMNSNPFRLLSCRGLGELESDYAMLHGARMNHEVTAVGLRFDSKTKKCLMRLRNSWGGRCTPFNAEANCQSSTGDLELPVDQLMSFINQATYLF